MCAACQNTQKTQPVPPKIVPAVEIKRPETPKHVLGIIGAVEPIYMLPMKTPFAARIDTGAENSSLDVDNMKTFERDGEKWVSFDLVNRQGGERHHFEKKILKFVTITRIHKSEKRPSVMMDVNFGGQIIKARSHWLTAKNSNIRLWSANILTGRAIVDTALSNTLR
ncbi:MAG: RimK/LysX family protein [Alphaproteobacteria bacterium]